MKTPTFEGLAALATKKWKLECQIDGIKDDMREMETALLKKMEQDGLTSVKLPRGRVIRMDRKIWASAGGDVPGLIEALRAEGLDDFVRDAVNAASLTGYARELDPQKMLSPEEIVAKMPPKVREAISVREEVKLIVTGHKK
jgi:hypothetical protein